MPVTTADRPVDSSLGGCQGLREDGADRPVGVDQYVKPEGFVVLRPSGTDRQQWLVAWRETGCEPFAHPDYLELFSGPGDRARCLVSRQPAGIAILPLLLRPLDDLEWSASNGLWDASSPYGFGGPFSSGSPDAAAVAEKLVEWMQKTATVTAFIRLALGCGLGPPAGRSGSPTRLAPGPGRPNVVVDLTRPPEEQWQHYEHKVRKNVNKARRAGLVVEVRSAFTETAEFTRLYLQTMDRRGSSRWYRFDQAFFDQLSHRLEGSFIVAEVRDPAGKLVSAELVLTSERRLYSFLGATLRDAFVHAPNDLLKHAVIEHGHLTGRAEYVLGGGFAADDGIFRYKRSFDRSGVVSFETCQVVADVALYEALVEQRKAGEERPRPDADAELDASYFPQYRAPLVAPGGYHVAPSAAANTKKEVPADAK